MNIPAPTTALRQRALQAALDRYNASNPPAPLAVEEFVAVVLDGVYDGWIQQLSVATITSAAFVLRFTAAENAAITSSTDPLVQGYLAQLGTHANVVLTDDLTVQGVNYLASVGLIAPQRVAQVLAF